MLDPDLFASSVNSACALCAVAPGFSLPICFMVFPYRFVSSVRAME